MSDDSRADPTRDTDTRLVTSVRLDEFDTATEAVVTTVATIENKTPRELPPLRTYVDADALDNILTTPRRSKPSNVRVAFVYLDYEVVVIGDETVAVFEAAEDQLENGTGSTDLHVDETFCSRADALDEFE